jgi:acid phosphatase (class A)
MRRATALLSLVAAGLVASSAVSQPTPPPQRPARLPGYLTQPIDASQLIGPPPAAGSPAEAADRAAYEATRALAGSPRWTQAIEDAKLTEAGAFRSWSCAAGVEIDAATTPRLMQLLLKVLVDAGGGTTIAKDVFKRPRPFVGNEAPVCIARPSLGSSASYPSGHAAAGWAWGLVLAEVVPDRADALTTRGRDFGESRVVCGVHYPSDIATGQMVASTVVAKLHAIPAFQEDVAAARAEVAKAPPAKSCNGPVVAAASH